MSDLVFPLSLLLLAVCAAALGAVFGLAVGIESERKASKKKISYELKSE